MPDFTDAQYYLNRECTWIKFNERVLREAIVPSNPLLEQLNFIAIASSNLDEFFMIRVAGVKHLVESGVRHIDIAGMTPAEQFDAIQSMVHELVADQYRYYDGIQQKLQDHGIHFIGVDELNEDQHMWLDEFFGREIYPVVTPMAVDSSHPFPFLSSLNRPSCRCRRRSLTASSKFPRACRLWESRPKAISSSFWKTSSRPMPIGSSSVVRS